MVSCYVRSRHHPLYGGTFLLTGSSVSPIPSYPPCWDTDHTFRDSATTQLPLCRLLYSVCIPPDGATSTLHCGTTIPDGHRADDDHDDYIVMSDDSGDDDDADDIINTTIACGTTEIPQIIRQRCPWLLRFLLQRPLSCLSFYSDPLNIRVR